MSRVTRPQPARSDPASLFLTLSTRALTGQQIMSSEGVGCQQRLDLRHVGRLLAEPYWPCLGFQHRGHAVVELGAQFVRLGGDDREAANCLAGGRAPSFPLSVGNRNGRPDCQGGDLIDRVAASAPVRELLFVEALGHTRVRTRSNRAPASST
jgi:hypothetical protein